MASECESLIIPRSLSIASGPTHAIPIQSTVPEKGAPPIEDTIRDAQAIVKKSGLVVGHAFGNDTNVLRGVHFDNIEIRDTQHFSRCLKYPQSKRRLRQRRPTLSIQPDFLRQRARWIRDDLDPQTARNGHDALHADDILKLDEFLRQLLSAKLSIEDIRSSRIHIAIIEIAGRGTRWPTRLIERCDAVKEAWEFTHGPLQAMGIPLYEAGGRLYEVCMPEDLSKEKLIMKWLRTPGATKLSPVKALRFGDLGFKPGDWWINPLFAFREGIINGAEAEGGIVSDLAGAYAVVMTGKSEEPSASRSEFVYQARSSDKGRYRLTAAKVGLIRHKVTGWTIKMDDKRKEMVYLISFKRLPDQLSMDDVLCRPWTEEIEDYREYKRLRKLARIQQTETARTRNDLAEPTVIVSADGVVEVYEGGMANMTLSSALEDDDPDWSTLRRSAVTSRGAAGLGPSGIPATAHTMQAFDTDGSDHQSDAHDNRNNHQNVRTSPSKLNEKQTSVRHRVLALKPPEDVEKALEDAKEARHRLTLQLYYGMPNLSDESGSVEGDTERMRLLNELQVIEAAKLAALIGRYVTMRAAMVLIGNETHAIRTLQAWLITPTICNDVNARNILQHVQRTLGHLAEAQKVLQAGLVPREAVDSPMASLLQGVRKLLDDTERAIVSHASTIASAQTSMKPDEAVQQPVELTWRSNLDATAKDLAAVKIALSPAARNKYSSRARYKRAIQLRLSIADVTHLTPLCVDDRKDAELPPSGQAVLLIWGFASQSGLRRHPLFIDQIPRSTQSQPLKRDLGEWLRRLSACGETIPELIRQERRVRRMARGENMRAKGLELYRKGEAMCGEGVKREGGQVGVKREYFERWHD
ncbi:hypothetical protein B0A55_08545 [Friedmanniomyces simplex]|uniref:Uncharacterized protein n=1 Tax=Friedmanniomyces simplex TaxID=329884 RepID=A0A4U0WZJ2_9PEZI|nr:hypothetical protein B0A55_08545 [Friedmanniomyces simplex]